MRAILVTIAIIAIALVVSPFLQFVWSHPKISDSSAVVMTSICLIIMLSPSLAFKQVRDYFKTPRR